MQTREDPLTLSIPRSISIPAKAILIAIGIHTLWGGLTVAIKVGLTLFPPMWSAFIRFTLGSICIISWARWQGIPFWPAREEWPVLRWLGVGFVVQVTVMNLGLNLTTSAMGAIQISTNPIFAALFAHFLLEKDRLTLPKCLGLGLAFLGTALVLLRSAGLEGIELAGRGNWMVLSSAALLGFMLIFSARLLRRIHPVRVMGWQTVLSLPVFAAAGLAWETIHWENLGWAPIAGLAYQGIVIAGLGFLVSAWLMKNYTPSIMASFNFIAPIAGVILSAWLLADPVTVNVILGMGLIGLGLFWIART